MPKSYIEYSELVQPKNGNYSSQSDFARIGKVTTQSVFKATGKHWKEWVKILDGIGARSWSHQEIVAFLKKKYRLTPWWQQGVTSGFEVAIGRRKEGQNAQGQYMVTVTKSLSCDVKKVWSFLTSASGQATWLKPLVKIKIQPCSQFETNDGFFGEIRTIAPNRRIRMYWQDPVWKKRTILELMLVPRAGKKSVLVFNHTGIPALKIKEVLRMRWRSSVNAVFAALN